MWFKPVIRIQSFRIQIPWSSHFLKYPESTLLGEPTPDSFKHSRVSKNASNFISSFLEAEIFEHYSGRRYIMFLTLHFVAS